MDSLQPATETDDQPEAEGRWISIIAGIRLYAKSRSPLETASVNEWADLLEGIRQFRGED